MALDYKRHFEREIIEICIRWHITEKCSSQEIAERAAKRGLFVTTAQVGQWLAQHQDSVRRTQAVLNANRVSESKPSLSRVYVKIDGEWGTLYRLLSRSGLCCDFFWSLQPQDEAAHSFFTDPGRSGRSPADAH